MAFESMRDMLEAAFSNPDRHCLVAVNGKGEVIGHRILKIKIDEEGRRFGEGWSLYIDPAYRNQGIASHLMRDADAWFCAQNVAYLETGTHVNNVKMQNLYAKQGYRFDRYGHNGVNPVYIVRKYL
jgi:ribosomal protein S18 acetylase RimI-like enzyme